MIVCRLTGKLSYFYLNMRLSSVIRFLLVVIFSAWFFVPANAMKLDPGKPVRFTLDEKIAKVFGDTVPPGRKPATTRPQTPPPSQVSRPEQSLEERMRNAERNSIKHVPRSVPKVKPQPVSDGMLVNRSTRN